MIKHRTLYIVFKLLILGLFLSSCNSVPLTPNLPTETPKPPTETPKPPTETPNPESISSSRTKIEKMANCWLHENGTGEGKWVGDGECTALARKLTYAESYGQGNGGVDYLKLQEEKGIIYPKLVDYLDQVKPCDILILVGSGYEPAGHTVVVFHTDMEHQIIYYLDQNFAGQGVRLWPQRFSDIENIAYVISSECKKPIDTTCFSVAEPLDNTPIPVQPLEVVSMQEIIIGGWPVLYNPDDWYVAEKSSGQSIENTLENKKISGCILQSIGQGKGVPLHWQKDASFQNFGSESIYITTWMDPNINKPALKIYDYALYNSDDMSNRLSVLLYHDPLKIGLDIEACIKEIENVITESVNR